MRQLESFELELLEDPAGLAGALLGRSENISECFRTLVEGLVIKNRKNMVALGSVLVAGIGYGRTSGHGEPFLKAIFAAAGKAMPDNLPATTTGKLQLENAELASAIVEIAKTDGMGWWRRRELLWRMRNY